jgi:aminocarboxymuconate-semialdehyde decarboxylase
MTSKNLQVIQLKIEKKDRSTLVVDFHNHFYPKAYIDELRREKGYAAVSKDDHGRLLIHYTGDYNVVVGGHIDLSERLRAMDKYGVDMQVLTLTTPGVEREAPERGIKLARMSNDEYAEIQEKYPDRFTALATLPLQAPEEAARELERAVKDLGLKGAMLLSNVNGKPLDSPEFMKIFELAAKLDTVLYIHPTSPINDAYMDSYRLVPIMGFGVDTSLAVLRLVFSGVLKRLPQLKLVATHVGGVYPFLRGRIDRGFEAYPECKVNISEPPSNYLKKVWMDSIIYDEDVLMSAIAFVTPEKLVLGSDYPHQIGDLEHCVQRIRRLKLSEADKEKILGENAAKLLKL